MSAEDSFYDIVEEVILTHGGVVSKEPMWTRAVSTIVKGYVGHLQKKRYQEKKRLLQYYDRWFRTGIEEKNEHVMTLRRVITQLD